MKADDLILIISAVIIAIALGHICFGAETIFTMENGWMVPL